MMELIITTASIWAPSLVAILSLVIVVMKCLKEARSTFKAFKEDGTLADLAQQVQNQAAENRELARTNKLLLDQITKIKDYADAKNKEG